MLQTSTEFPRRRRVDQAAHDAAARYRTSAPTPRGRSRYSVTWWRAVLEVTATSAASSTLRCCRARRCGERRTTPMSWPRSTRSRRPISSTSRRITGARSWPRCRQSEVAAASRAAAWAAHVACASVDALLEVLLADIRDALRETDGRTSANVAPSNDVARSSPDPLFTAAGRGAQSLPAISLQASDQVHYAVAKKSVGRPSCAQLNRRTPTSQLCAIFRIGPCVVVRSKDITGRAPL
jgi:hypothetical protein